MTVDKSICNQNGFMGSVTVGSKGQIVIPKQVREMFGINPGDTLLLLANERSGIAIPKAQESEKIVQSIMREIQNKENDNGSNQS